MATTSVRILSGALDEMPAGSSTDSIVIRGVIDPTSLQLLQAADYQREIAPLAQIGELVKALKTGRVPDIELGMRGDHVIDREGIFYLHDPVFIVDGLQRVTAAKHLMNQGGTPRLGTLVHLNTNESWERERFRILNTERVRVSPNVILRNLRKDCPAIELIWQVGHEKDFVLHDRICWTQRMRRQDLISALTFIKTLGALHGHLGPGRSHNMDELGGGFQKIVDKIGKNVFRDNVRTFWQLVDQSWGIQRVAFKEGATYLRSSFLWCLASLLSRHEDFWRGTNDHRLFIEAELMRKISQFPVADPEVSRLASSGGKARELLYMLMFDHVNRGKRTRRLTVRPESTKPAEAARQAVVTATVTAAALA